MGKVEISETSVIVPSSPPFSQDHTLPLSHLDNDRNLHVIFRYLRSYRGSDDAAADRNPYHAVSTAVSSALVPYYPLAGSLHRRAADDFRLELRCCAGQGLPLINASVDCSLASVNYLDGASDLASEFLDSLVPNPSLEEGMQHPCILQLTTFDCGGWTLGVAIHHALCDGVGATQFFAAAAELARGSNRVSIDPVWDRERFLCPRVPLKVEALVRDFLVLGNEFKPYDRTVGPVAREGFHVADEWLDRFKGLLVEKSGLSFTTFEALGAFIWRAKVKASKVPNEAKVKFAYSMNVRKLVNPPLPRGYWGNGCVPMYAELSAGTLTEQPLWKTALLIKQSKSYVTDDYVRSFVDFQEMHYMDGINAGPEVSGFTDWRHLGHSAVDFGWGGPVTVLPLSRNLLGSTEPCFFLPYSAMAGSGNGGTKEGGFKVLVTMRAAAMAEFKKEMEKFGRGEFTCLE